MLSNDLGSDDDVRRDMLAQHLAELHDLGVTMLRRSFFFFFFFSFCDDVFWREKHGRNGMTLTFLMKKWRKLS